MQITWKQSAITALMFFMAATSASAAQLPPKLESAIAKFEAHQDHDVRFAFTRETYKDNRKVEVKRFNPTRPRAEMWKIELPSRATDPGAYEKAKRKYSETEGYSDVDLIVPDLRKRLADGATFLRKEKDVDVYGFPVADTYILDGGGRKKDIHKDIMGEIAINQHSNDIEWIRYYAPKPFKPISIVQLTKYDIKQYVKPAWPGGPLVRVYETSKVQGSAPFTTIHVDEIMRNMDFSKKTLGVQTVRRSADNDASSGQ